MSFISLVKTLISLLPILISAVQSLETALPESGQGAKKLEALKGILQAAYTTAQEVSVPFETLWPALSGTVAALVALFKK